MPEEKWLVAIKIDKVNPIALVDEPGDYFTKP
jgi:hypothetical protein